MVYKRSATAKLHFKRVINYR